MSTLYLNIDIDSSDIDLTDFDLDELIEGVHNKLKKSTKYSKKDVDVVFEIGKVCDTLNIPFFDAKTVEESLKVELFQRTWDKYTLTELEQILTR